MPSFSHDGYVRLFYNRPELAVELVRDVLGIEVPAYSAARIDSADLTDLEPASRYADLVVLLERDKPVAGIVVEVQLDVDPDKPFSWPAYLSNLRARLRCDVELLIVTPSARVASWAARPIPIGRGYICPLVVGPEGVPQIIEETVARRDPELAVLSAMAHAEGPVERAVPIALAALAGIAGIADERAALYSDLVMAALNESARAALEELMRAEKKYEYQTEFARHHQAVGRAEGEVKGKAEGVLTVLEARGLAVDAEQRARIVGCSDAAMLEHWLRKAVTVARTEDLFD